MRKDHAMNERGQSMSTLFVHPCINANHPVDSGDNRNSCADVAKDGAGIIRQPPSLPFPSFHGAALGLCSRPCERS